MNLLKPYNRVTLQFLADELLIQTVEGEENIHYTVTTTNIETENCIVLLLLHDERDDVCGVHAVNVIKSLIPPCNIFNLSLNELL